MARPTLIPQDHHLRRKSGVDNNRLEMLSLESLENEDRYATRTVALFRPCHDVTIICILGSRRSTMYTYRLLHAADEKSLQCVNRVGGGIKLQSEAMYRMSAPANTNRRHTRSFRGLAIAGTISNVNASVGRDA